MKLRCIPEDFLVTEITDRRPGSGAYGFYELRKQSIGTLEAIQIAQRSWNLAPNQFSHGGLKDRHAMTTQFLTIRNGPEADFSHDLFELEYLGTTDKAFDAQGIVANQFEIVIRSLAADESRQFQNRAQLAAGNGYPNYFDEQRFGSLGESQEFIAVRWCLKDYERALWLALAEHNRHDSPAEREQKQILRDTWGQWSQCKEQLERSHRRSVVTYLVDHPDRFRKAFALVNGNLRGLYLSAFQSAVWNRMLATVIRNSDSAPATLPQIEIGDAVLPLSGPQTIVPAEYHELPLPSVRCKKLTKDLRNLCDTGLKPYGMTLPEMKVHFPRDRWFSRALRKTSVVPRNMTAETGNDELHSGLHKLTLTFELPRGCYATMLIKSISAETQSSEIDDPLATAEFQG